MSTNRQRRARTREGIALDGSIEEFLFTGEAERGTPAWELRTSRFFDQGAEIRRAWEQHREYLLAQWISQHPGTRPWAWWRFDDEIPEPRRRLGGIGQTMAERYPAVVAHFEKGLPASWVEINEDDPPTFLSEAAYLLQYGILTASEKKWLAGHPEAMKPEAVTI